MRNSVVMRDMLAETKLQTSMLMYPMFVCKGKNIKNEISSMPNVYHFSVNNLLKEVELLLNKGIHQILLFGVGAPKSENADAAIDEKGIVPEAVRSLKKAFGNDLLVATDVCVCAYTTHGHCGIVHNEYVNNDASAALIAQMALRHAEAGADIVAPSDMMDARVGAIRQLLEENGFDRTGIMSYAVKYASAYYGPFREAANSAPGYGDRKSYQMDIRNRREALREAHLDLAQGADIIMVKPALAFLDIIRDLRNETNAPLACYNVSGEYAMVKAAARMGWLNEAEIVRENLYAFARAGADILISYHAKDAVENNWL